MRDWRIRRPASSVVRSTVDSLIVSPTIVFKVRSLASAKLARTRYSFEALWDKAVVWDRSIATIRGFQAAFLGAISEVLAKPALSRWMNLVHHPTTSVVDITNPFVDTWNLRYIEMNRETRAKNLGIITKRFVEHRLDPEDQEYRYAINRAVLQHECAEGDVRFDGLDYPEEIEW